MMEFRVLGPISVADEHGEIDVGGPRQRRLLGALVAQANTTVATDALIEIVFEGVPPSGASTTMRTYVARLRKALSGTDASIATADGGYRLETDPATIDATAFERATEYGRDQFDGRSAIEAAETLRNALAMWRGPAYGEFGAEEWARADAARLEELRLDTREQLVDAQLACGLAEDTIPELRRLVALHPLRERLWSQLMLALHRTGRQVEAMRAYDEHRAAMIDVGLEPTPTLSSLAQSIAAHDPALQLAAPSGSELRGYRLSGSLGVGHHGEVFRAIQPTIGREVAVKVIRPELADQPNFIQRFDGEARAVSRLEHPHIVPVYDYWRDPSAAYIVMRLLPSNLGKQLEDGPATLVQVTGLVRQLGAALSAAHGVGLVHGDLRPSNALVDAHGNYFLSDFGLAGMKLEHADEPPDRTAYVSPEVRSGQAADRASDQHALAVLAMHALTGIQPFGARGVMSEADPVPSMHAQRSEVPAAVDPVVRRAAAWHPEERYPTIAEFADALIAALDER